MRRLLAAGVLVLCFACGRAEPESEPEAVVEESAPVAPEAPLPPPPAPEPTPKPAPSPLPPPAPAPAPVPEPLPEAAAPTIGLDELADRLKQTQAIGVFTKLALKNDIDDLLAALRGFHHRGEGEILKLRNRFEVLTLKVQTLLESAEPDLARTLARSREEIWQLLADPERFATLKT